MSGILLATVGNSYGSAPVNTVAPAVTGTASFGSTLTTTNGTWTGAPAPTFTYQWQRVTTNISGATSSTYVLVAADVGNTIRCVVRATNSIAPSGVTANSNSTASVAAVVPGAPTIGTATATTATAATVAYTAPASNGGATITTYTATSSPGGLTGTLSQAGSGTITVSGLTTGTAYTFTVKATNSAGQSAASAASNSVTPAVTGQQAFTTVGSFTWVAPAGVTKVSVVAIGGGYVRGGTLAYTNNITVVPGCSYAVVVGSGAVCTAGITSRFVCNPSASGGISTPIYTGTAGYYGAGNPLSADGGGTGGYAGNGGTGTGGSGGYGGFLIECCLTVSGGGGGVGLLGQGSSGANGSANCLSNSRGRGGSGGADGVNATRYKGGNGGLYGGGVGRGCTGVGNSAGSGAVRIIWPGNTRSFPSTNTGDL